MELSLEELLRMARDSGAITGFKHVSDLCGDGWLFYPEELERFAAAIADAIEATMRSDGWRQCAKGQRITQFCGQLEAAVAAERAVFYEQLEAVVASERNTQELKWHEENDEVCRLEGLLNDEREISDKLMNALKLAQMAGDINTRNVIAEVETMRKENKE